MRILGLIPARGGSKGILRKNIKLLNGIPLIGYTIKAAHEANVLTKVIVSTDDEEIARISTELGAEVPFMRPNSLGTDQSTSFDVVIHALEYFKKKGEDFDAVCLLQPTVPFRSSLDISKSILQFESTNADSLISVQEIPHKFNPNWAFIDSNNSDFLEFANNQNGIISRRQELPKSYHRDGSIYITRTQVLLEKESLYGDKIAYYENKGDSVINIDTEEDWELAEKFITKNEC
jgi:CMP-N,N'-diacetyllegionaminic acid synthase